MSLVMMFNGKAQYSDVYKKSSNFAHMHNIYFLTFDAVKYRQGDLQKNTNFPRYKPDTFVFNRK